MVTSVQLFRHEHKLSACALVEPSITLIRNDEEFGLLIASRAHEDSFSNRLYLEEVAYLTVSGQDWKWVDFDTVVLFKDDEVWLAQDLSSGLYLPNPSSLPYHVIFLSNDEYLNIRKARTRGLAYPAFSMAQRHFGRLPGFSVRGKSLETPACYANRRDAVPSSEYMRVA